MPTYHYACTSCAHEFDQYQPFSADPLTDCPACDGRIRRVIQPVGVVFKGTGWYLTDSRKPESTDGGSTVAKDTAADASSDKAGDAAKPDAPKKDAAKPKAEPAAKKSVESKPTAAAAT